MLKQRLWSKKEWDRRFPNSVQRYSDLYKNVYHEPDPQSEAYFEKTLAFMNEQGATPLIVLTPINPKLRKILGPLGWDGAPRAGRRLHRVAAGQVPLQVPRPHRPVRCSASTRKQFYDGMHMTTINTEKAIDYILKKTGGVPPVKPPASGK